MEYFKDLSILFAALVASGSAIFGYFYQSKKDREEKRRAERKAQYEIILFNVFKLLYQKPGKDYAETLIEIEKSWLYASDEVLKNCYLILDLHKDICLDKTGLPINGLKTNPDLLDDFNKALGVLFASMRHDLKLGKKKNEDQWPQEKVELFPAGILAMDNPEDS